MSDECASEKPTVCQAVRAVLSLSPSCHLELWLCNTQATFFRTSLLSTNLLCENPSPHVVNTAFSSSLLSDALGNLYGNTHSLCRRPGVFAFVLPLITFSLLQYPYHIIHPISGLRFSIMFGSCTPCYFLILSYSAPALFPLSPFLSYSTRTHKHTYTLTHSPTEIVIW